MSDERMEVARRFAAERMDDLYEEFLLEDWEAAAPPTSFQAAVIKAYLMGECFMIAAGRQSGKTTVREAIIRCMKRKEREYR